MSLAHETFIIVDCQTTGMRPPAGALIELSWSILQKDRETQIKSFLIRQPLERPLPPKVQSLTGITPEMLSAGMSEEEVFRLFFEDLQRLGNPRLIIHYAQFERPFLLDLFEKYLGVKELPSEIICTYQIAKKVCPTLPTLNIQGLCGYFGFPLKEFKRARENVLATLQIWEGLRTELEKKGVVDAAGLVELLGLKTKSKKKFDYPLAREKRLELPDLPGVYRMIAKTGEVLYVGKATSLRDRVNSYFRGQKGRDRRKLELMIQVWDIQVTVCENPVMAAILENDEIKRLNPKYNISLKAGHRKLVFFDREFKERSFVQDDGHPLGPYRGSSPIEQLRSLHVSLGTNHFDRIFFEPISSKLQREGFLYYCSEHDLSLGAILSVRDMLAHGLRLLREGVGDLAEEEEVDAPELTVEAVAAKYGRLFRRAAKEHLKSRRANELLNSKVVWEGKDQRFEVFIANGKISETALAEAPSDHPWTRLSLTDFDRLMILQSELGRYNHQIEKRPG